MNSASVYLRRRARNRHRAFLNVLMIVAWYQLISVLSIYYEIFFG